MTCGSGCTACGWKASHEIRAANLRFTLDEARRCSARPGELPESALTLLHARPRLAAGLRLPPCRWPAPDRSGSRPSSPAANAQCEYLLAEVLERQSEEVRRLLLRTSYWSGQRELATCLPGFGGSGSCRT